MEEGRLVIARIATFAFKRGPKKVEEAMQALDDYGMGVVGPHPRGAAGA
jgi:hypothetical protein